MANERHLGILRQGVVVWNKWRAENPFIRPDLGYVRLTPNLVKTEFTGPNLGGINLSGTDLRGALLDRVYLAGANLSGANLATANLSEAILIDSNLAHTNLAKAVLVDSDLTNSSLRNAMMIGADLRGAQLDEADLTSAGLNRALLIRTSLRGTNFTDANLVGADFSQATLGLTVFGDNILRDVKGLDTVIHVGPSNISISTLYRIETPLPETFLRGCGVPESLIEYLPSLIGAMEPIQYYSCFISYSSQNEDFAERLHGRMQQAHLRVWYAPEDMKGGQKIYQQIDEAIRLYDKLVLVLSKESIQSEWVMTEIRKARKAELRDKRRKLFPIRLVDMHTLRDWECFDADTGKDLAVEVREYHIPDFSRWKDHDSFERAFARLLKDLQATEAPPVPAPRPVQTKPTASSQPASMGSQAQPGQSVIELKQRRLRLLEERQARMGHNTPPEFLMEIEDLRKELEGI